jgi:hypothetical protein
MARRTQELIFAFMIVALLIWAVITQPIIPPTSSLTLLRLDPQKLETNMMALGGFKGELSEAEDNVIIQTADYLSKQLENFGVIESKGYSAGLHQVNLQIGKVKVDDSNAEFPIASPRLILVMHHVVSTQPSWDGAKALAGIIELAQRLHEETKTQKTLALELVVFIHHAQTLSETIMAATESHVSQLARDERQNDRVLVWMPGIVLPDAYTSSSHWGFLEPAAPSDDSDVQLYSRLADYAWLRDSKTLFRKADIEKVESLTVLSSFPKVKRFPLNNYWEAEIPALLIKTKLVGVSQDYADLMRFLTGLDELLKVPVQLPKPAKGDNKE